MNTYDDENFFCSYIELRSGANYNDLLEIPAMLDLIGDVRGKNILDIGCGFGLTDEKLAGMGAAHILGIDISSRMIAKAMKKHKRENIEYRVMDADDISSIPSKFDLVISSLAFHYIKDLDKLLRDIRERLNEKGLLIFSSEHPLSTADYNGFYSQDSDGAWNGYTFSSYGMEGKRDSEWFGAEVTTYHRMFSSIVNAISDSGFVLKRVAEPLPGEEEVKVIPRLLRERHKPSFIIFKAEAV